MRFHLRHASAGSSFKLCLLKASSLCLARRASRPFFFPLASTKPPLSELGRSFGLLPLRHLSAPSENPRRFSVVIPLKSSYRPCFQGALQVAGSSRFRYSSESVCRRAFHPVAVLACRELYQLPPFCQFFSRCFFIFFRASFRPRLSIHPLTHI